MKVTPKNLVRHELVGMNAHIVESKDPSLLCRRGTIVDESKETIRLDTGDGEIMTPKSVCVFGLRLPGGELVHIDGCLLRGRPEERLKKSARRRH